MMCHIAHKSLDCEQYVLAAARHLYGLEHTVLCAAQDVQDAIYSRRCAAYRAGLGSYMARSQYVQHEQYEAAPSKLVASYSYLLPRAPVVELGFP